MRLYEFAQPQQPDLNSIIREVLPLIKHELKITKLPKIRLVNQIIDANQPTFGRYQDNSNTLEVVKKNRHPVDILRTLAHELTHYKQDVEDQLGPHSGDTGSSIEDQAHMVAGVIMRHIDKKYPNFLKLDNVDEAIRRPMISPEVEQQMAELNNRSLSLNQMLLDYKHAAQDAMDAGDKRATQFFSKVKEIQTEIMKIFKEKENLKKMYRFPKQ